jgi:hypothetical protein
MRSFSALVVVALGGGSVTAAPDETLKFYLSKAQFVLAGEVVGEPVEWEKPFHWGEDKKNPLTVYEVRVKVLDQFQYDIQPYGHKEMTVHVLLADGMERPDALKKGAKCIFFLNWRFGGPGGPTSYVPADPWFGVLRYEPKLAEGLTAQGKRPPRAN